MCTVGQVKVTLPEGEGVAGVAIMEDEVFVLRGNKSSDQIEVYDNKTHLLKRRLSVPNIRGFADMTASEHYCCVYIVDHIAGCIHKIHVKYSEATRWAISDEPLSISENMAHNVLVTCLFVRKIKEFRSHGELLREVKLPVEVNKPRHAIQLANGQLVVCHGGPGGQGHRVCLLTADGGQIVHSYSGEAGSLPYHVEVDDNGFVFVADLKNQKVTVLSPTLNFIRQFGLASEEKWWPWRLVMDMVERRLYVAAMNDNDLEAGRVVVFSV